VHEAICAALLCHSLQLKGVCGKMVASAACFHQASLLLACIAGQSAPRRLAFFFTEGCACSWHAFIRHASLHVGISVDGLCLCSILLPCDFRRLHGSLIGTSVPPHSWRYHVRVCFLPERSSMSSAMYSTTLDLQPHGHIAIVCNEAWNLQTTMSRTTLLSLLLLFTALPAGYPGC
jgi:hypothetical protein